MAISLKYAIMCDEVRREDNGKLLILGVYNDVMISPAFPFNLPGLTFFMKLDCDRPGSWSVRMRLEHLESGEKLFEALGALEFQKPGPGLNPIRLPPIQFRSPGVYNFVMEPEGQQPILYEFTVAMNLRQSPSAGVPGIIR